MPDYVLHDNLLTMCSTTAELCNVHGPSQTPQIDGLLRQPSTVAAIQSLREALAGLVDEAHCTKCATESTPKALTSFAKDIRAAMQNGQWSKEEKKTVKKEAKWLFKGMKGNMKEMWNEKSSN